MQGSGMRGLDGTALMHVLERAAYSYSPSYDGWPSETVDLGDALLQRPLTSVAGVRGSLGRFDLDPAGMDARISALCTLLAPQPARYLWRIGPATRPVSLAERLEQRGLTVRLRWHAMVLRDLRAVTALPSGVSVEPLNAENSLELARLTAGVGAAEDTVEAQHAAYERVLRDGRNQTRFFLARCEGSAAAWASMRFEAQGVAYFRQGSTHPDYRGRGLYRALVARRAALAHAEGCTAAVVSALETTSAPILARLGFVSIGRLTAYTLPDDAGTPS